MNSRNEAPKIKRMKDIKKPMATSKKDLEIKPVGIAKEKSTGIKTVKDYKKIYKG